MDKKNIIQTYLNYVIRNYPNLISSEFLSIAEKIIQNHEIKNEQVIYYFIYSLQTYYTMKNTQLDH